MTAVRKQVLILLQYASQTNAAACIDFPAEAVAVLHGLEECMLASDCHTKLPMSEYATDALQCVLCDMKFAGACQARELQAYIDCVSKRPLEAPTQTEDVLGGFGRSWELCKLTLDLLLL